MSRPRSDRAIVQTLEIATNAAFRMLRRGKYRRAQNLAYETLRHLPPKVDKSGDAAMLRVIGSAGRHLADWYAAEDRARKRKKRTRRKEEKRPHVAELLLVPESLASDRTGPDRKLTLVDKP
jgi:hypothetical protein